MSTRKLQRQIARAMTSPNAAEIEQLEALGYRTIAEIERCQQLLRQINARLQELRGGAPTPPTAPPPPEPEA